VCVCMCVCVCVYVCVCVNVYVSVYVCVCSLCGLCGSVSWETVELKIYFIVNPRNADADDDDDDDDVLLMSTPDPLICSTALCFADVFQKHAI